MRLKPGLLKGISVSQGEERGCGTNTCYVVNRVPENHGNHTQHGLTQCRLVVAGGGYGGKKAMSKRVQTNITHPQFTIAQKVAENLETLANACLRINLCENLRIYC